MSSEVETVQPKGEPVVKFCPISGEECDETVLTNRWLRCDSCDSVFMIKVKIED